jgi:hypothetical protein
MSTISFLYISYFEELWHKNPSTLVRCQGLTINTNVCQSTYFLIWLGACSSAWLSWKSQSWTWKLWRIDFHQERSIASKALAQCHTPEENGRSPWKWLWIIWPLWSSTNQEKDKTYIYILYLYMCIYIYIYIYMHTSVYIYNIYWFIVFYMPMLACSWSQPFPKFCGGVSRNTFFCCKKSWAQQHSTWCGLNILIPHVPKNVREIKYWIIPYCPRIVSHID